MKTIIYKLFIGGVLSQNAEKLIAKGITREFDRKLSLSFFCAYAAYEIPMGTRFDHLTIAGINITFEIDALLVNVTQNWALPFDYVPYGHKTICTFLFPDTEQMNMVIDKISASDSWISDYNIALIKSDD